MSDTISFQILVKGNIPSAIAACEAKLPAGCTLHSYREIPYGVGSPDIQTALGVQDYPSNAMEMWSWFGEVGTAPYPWGTLLTFAEEERMPEGLKVAFRAMASTSPEHKIGENNV